MVMHKRKKNVKQRGSKTHGYGSMKKHRGAGHRGGKGNAGTGKRAGTKKPTLWNIHKGTYLGKRGFNPNKGRKVKTKTTNIFYLEEQTDKWLKKGIAKVEKDIYIIDLKKIGYTKLLGEGQVTKKYRIIIGNFSKKAEEKIKKAGGEIVKSV